MRRDFTDKFSAYFVFYHKHISVVVLVYCIQKNTHTLTNGYSNVKFFTLQRCGVFLLEKHDISSAQINYRKLFLITRKVYFYKFR